jgi:hypothetical protein
VSEQSTSYEGWSVLELMGHRRLIGYVQEATLAGAPFLRIDVLTKDGQSTQYYSAAAVYALTPTTEETARRAASLSSVAPISRWELPEPGRTAPEFMEDYQEGSDE